MPDTTEAEVLDLLPAVRHSSGIVRQVVPTAEVAAAQEEYHDLCRTLLDPTQDYQRIGRRDFPKKSAWRKLSVAFNVSVELRERVYERDGGGRIIRAEVVARATAPNGRFMDGIGACDVFEKCCPGADGQPEDCDNRSQYHRHCPAGCSGRRHFSNPSHDLPSTAHTRATNRACADLFGMGEVSAEEVGSHAPAEALELDPYVTAGWDSEDAHHTLRRTIDAHVKTMPDAGKAAVRAWVEDPANGTGGTFKSIWTPSVVAAYGAMVSGLLLAGEVPPPQDPASPQETADTGRSEPETGDDTPEGEQNPLATAVEAQVGRMTLAGVRAELRDRGEDPEGKPDEVRSRLVEAICTERWESTSDDDEDRIVTTDAALAAYVATLDRETLVEALALRHAPAEGTDDQLRDALAKWLFAEGWEPSDYEGSSS